MSDHCPSLYKISLAKENIIVYNELCINDPLPDEIKYIYI